MRRIQTTVALLVAAFALSGFALERETSTLYAGGGTDSNFALGFLWTGNPWMFGFDIAQEGEYVDRTGGYADVCTSRWGGVYDCQHVPRSIESSISLNFLAGRNIEIKGHTGSIGIGGLVGRIITEKSCSRQSYLGYACYADEDPKEEADVNLGAWAVYQRRSLMVGVRYAQSSPMLVLGYRF